MYIDMTHGKPLTCSKCGSTNAIKPLNGGRFVAVRCGDCGHEKLTPEGQQRKFDREHPGWRDRVYKSDKDRENTF